MFLLRANGEEDFAVGGGVAMCMSKTFASHRWDCQPEYGAGFLHHLRSLEGPEVEVGLEVGLLRNTLWYTNSCKVDLRET